MLGSVILAAVLACQNSPGIVIPGCSVVPDGHWGWIGQPGQQVCWVWIPDAAPRTRQVTWYRDFGPVVRPSPFNIRQIRRRIFGGCR